MGAGKAGMSYTVFMRLSSAGNGPWKRFWNATGHSTNIFIIQPLQRPLSTNEASQGPSGGSCPGIYPLLTFLIIIAALRRQASRDAGKFVFDITI